MAAPETIVPAVEAHPYKKTPWPAHWGEDLPLMKIYEGFACLEADRHYWIWKEAPFPSLILRCCSSHSLHISLEFPVTAEGSILYKGAAYRNPKELLHQLIDENIDTDARNGSVPNILIKALLSPISTAEIKKIENNNSRMTSVIHSLKSCENLESYKQIIRRERDTVFSIPPQILTFTALAHSDSPDPYITFLLDEGFINKDVIKGAPCLGSRKEPSTPSDFSFFSEEFWEDIDHSCSNFKQFPIAMTRQVIECLFEHLALPNFDLFMGSILETFSEPDSYAFIQEVASKYEIRSPINHLSHLLLNKNRDFVFSYLREITPQEIVQTRDIRLKIKPSLSEIFATEKREASSKEARDSSQHSHSVLFHRVFTHGLEDFFIEMIDALARSNRPALNELLKTFDSQKNPKIQELLNRAQLPLIKENLPSSKGRPASIPREQLFAFLCAKVDGNIEVHGRTLIGKINSKEILDYIYENHEEVLYKLFLRYFELAIYRWKSFFADSKFFKSPRFASIAENISAEYLHSPTVALFFFKIIPSLVSPKNYKALFCLLSDSSIQEKSINPPDLFSKLCKLFKKVAGGVNLGAECNCTYIIDFFYRCDPHLVEEALLLAIERSNCEWISALFSSELIGNDSAFFQKNLPLFERALHQIPLLDHAIKHREKLSSDFFSRIFGEEFSEESIRLRLGTLFLINSFDSIREAIKLSMDNERLQPFLPFINKEVDRLTLLAGFIARSRKTLFLYSIKERNISLEAFAQQQIAYAQSRMTLVSQIPFSFHLLQTIKKLMKPGSFSVLSITHKDINIVTRLQGWSRYAPYMKWVEETLNHPECDGVVFTIGGFYLYHPSIGKDVPLTHVVFSEEASAKWIHTKLASLKRGLPYYINLYNRLKKFDLSHHTLDDFTKLLAEYYWLGTHLMLTDRGNAQYVLDITRFLLHCNGLVMGPATIDATFPDCIALSVTLDRFTTLFPTLWEFPPRIP